MTSLRNAWFRIMIVACAVLICSLAVARPVTAKPKVYPIAWITYEVDSLHAKVFYRFDYPYGAAIPRIHRHGALVFLSVGQGPKVTRWDVLSPGTSKPDPDAFGGPTLTGDPTSDLDAFSAKKEKGSAAAEVEFAWYLHDTRLTPVLGLSGLSGRGGPTVVVDGGDGIMIPVGSPRPRPHRPKH